MERLDASTLDLQERVVSINRVAKTVAAEVPIVNYGVAIAHMNGILKRSLQIFPEIQKILD